MTEAERAVLIGHERASVRQLRKMLRAAFPDAGHHRISSVIAQFMSASMVAVAMLVGLSSQAQQGCTVTYGEWSEWTKCGDPITSTSALGLQIGVHDTLRMEWGAGATYRKQQMRWRLAVEDCGLKPKRWQMEGRRCQ